ncbi:MAG: hypothetical protein LBG95_06495 [Treponema sp.]|jgi:hypothetical protein|nr:hypothetical protein [Treponema sp.]
MKNIFALAAIFTLVFAACDDWGAPEVENTNSATMLKIQNESSVDIAEVVWHNVSFASNQSEKSIKTGTSVTRTVQPGSGYIYFFFKRDANPVAARTKDLIVVDKDEQKEFRFLDTTLVVDVDNPGNSATFDSLQPILTTLKIKNESLIEITDVIWQGTSIANSQYDNSIKPGITATANVEAGGGYIFFKRKSNPVTARTAETVIIEKGENIDFTFTGNTPIVEVNNPDNAGTLSSVQSTVVFWDDAEGEMQQYHLKQSFVGYYGKDGSGLPSRSYFYNPKNGNKSIAVGGTNTAKLHLKIDLAGKAKLSFWYANRYTSTAGTTFSINGVQKAKWVTDIDWSFMTFDLEPGSNDLIWEKKDGVYGVYNVDYSYLCLDDILIYYTE